MKIESPEERRILAKHLPADVVADLKEMAKGHGGPFAFILVEDKELEKKLEKK